MLYQICPECQCDALKTRDMAQQDYDASTGRMAVHGSAVEYRCPNCGWTALVEDAYSAESQMEDMAGGPLSGP